MDLNHLYFRHQLLLMQASGASNERTSLKHEEKAARIARSIGAFQASAGATAATSWQADGVQ
jgi:hypothetical protein